MSSLLLGDLKLARSKSDLLADNLARVESKRACSDLVMHAKSPVPAAVVFRLHA